MLTSTADLSEWDSDKKNTYVKHLENNISDLTGDLFAILKEKSELEEQKKTLEALELENKLLRNVQDDDTPTKGIQSQMKGVSIKEKSVKEQLKSYASKVKELEEQIGWDFRTPICQIRN